MNLVQLKSLLSWQCRLDSDHLLRKIPFQMGSTDWERKSKNFFRRNSQNTNTLQTSQLLCFLEKTCERLRNFTFISHTYLDVFLDSCGVFCKWNSGGFGPHADIVLKNVLLFSSVKCSVTLSARVNVPVQPVFLPHKEQSTSPGSAAKQQGRGSADRSTNFLCLSFSNVWKIPRQVTAVFSTPSPMPLRPDWNFGHPFAISTHRITAAWIVFSSHNFSVSH